MALLVTSIALCERGHRCGNCWGTEWEMEIDWTWISPAAEAPGKKVGTVSLKRWQRNLHNRHYSLHFVCRSAAAVRLPLHSVSISSHLTDTQPEANDRSLSTGEKAHPFSDLYKSGLKRRWIIWDQKNIRKSRLTQDHYCSMSTSSMFVTVMTICMYSMVDLLQPSPWRHQRGASEPEEHSDHWPNHRLEHHHIPLKEYFHFLFLFTSACSQQLLGLCPPFFQNVGFTVWFTARNLMSAV